MLDRRTARSAAAKPKAAVATASRAKASTQAASGKPAAPKPRIAEMREYIQRRAYELWESEGRPTGRDWAHWLQAESEIARARAQRAGVTR